MNISVYTQDVQDLIKNIQVYAQKPGNYVFKLLKKLSKINEKNNDYVINGFIYYTYSLIYLSNEKHNLFLTNLKKALYYLLRSEEKEYTARAYNLFAIEAQKNGHFDIAYDYYQMAMSFVSDDKKSLIYGMIVGNIGDLYAKMGDFKNAYKYSSKGFPIVMKYQDDETNAMNRMIIMVNLSIYNLSLGKLKEAKETLDYLNQYGVEGLQKIGEEAVLWYYLYSMRYAIATNNKNRLYELEDIVKQKIISSVFFNEFIQETYDLCTALIGIKEWNILGNLLDAIDKNKDVNIYAALLFNRMKITYYKNINDYDNLLISYKRLHEYSMMNIEKQKETYYESIELMSLYEELYSEELKIEKENIILQEEALTDGLTGIANRYALNRNLERDFEIALVNNKRIGVGIADIDAFKLFNDNYGHQKGDECLIEVANKLSMIAEDNNLFVARYGGDEFVFIYNDMSDKEIEKIQEKIANCCDVSLSHGYYANYPDENSRIFDYIAEADKRLYEKKRARK